MKILARYIRRNIILSILMVVAMLTAFELFVQFFNQFPDIGVGNYKIGQVIVYVLLMLPQNIYQFFPMAGLIGSLLALGQMAVHSELIVMRAGGVSVFKIAKMVLQAALILLIFAVVMGEVVGPYAQHVATRYKAAKMTSGQALHTRRGTWIHSGNDFIHIDKILPHNKLQNITRYQFNNKYKLQTVSFAKSADYHHNRWTFYNIAQTTLGADNVTSDSYPKQHWQFRFNPKVLGLIDINTTARSLPELYSYIRYLHRSGLRANKYEADFWQRIVQPLAALVMILLAVPFIFGPLRTVPMGLRILIGVIVGFAFYIINQFVGMIAVVYQVPAIYVAILPTLLIALLASYLLSRSY